MDMTKGCCGVVPAASGYATNGQPSKSHQIIAEVIQSERDAPDS
jgi:hypothetical protein